MGRIVEGAVSGELPERVAFAVNYPGYPSSMASAIRTLGGEEGLQRARQSEGNFLEMKFRPDDPYAHPAFGELRHTSDLLLRLSRSAVQTCGTLNKSLSANDLVESEEASGQSRITDGNSGRQTREVTAEIIARVEHTYSFDGMADYQFVVAVHADSSKPEKRKAADQSWVDANGSDLDNDNGEMMILVPPLFSVKDLPEDIFLRPPSGKKKMPLVIEDAAPVDNHVPCLALDFKTKQIPPIGNWEHRLIRGSEPWLRTAALVRLFQERPIWTKSMLNERLIGQGISVTDYYLRSLLFRIAYYFGNGPFRNLWIRNGYDPRLDPESRAHQMIDFRVPAILRGLEWSPVQMWNFSDMCAFKAKPQKKFTQFQIIDLQDDDIQAQIERPPERTSCSETNGWFRLRTIKKLRQIVRLRFLALYPGDIARDLESAERKSLEQLKFAPETDEDDDKPSDGEPADLNPRLHLEAGQNDICTMGESGVPQLGFSVKDKLCAVDLDVNEDEEDEDEEDNEGDLKPNDEDDEEEEEELEEQLSQEGISELQKNLTEGHLVPADNIPKNYLEALLGKFYNSDVNKSPSNVADVDEYGEYTIYEPVDDDDDSDN